MAQELPNHKPEETYRDIPYAGGEFRPPLSTRDNPNLNASLSKDSTFNEKKRQESIDAQVREKVTSINMVINKYKQFEQITVINSMNFLEELISSAGGESRVNFLEVDRGMVKIATRMPMKANLHPMLPESKDNPRFHKFITQILLSMDFIQAVKWVPTEFGALLITELK